MNPRKVLKEVNSSGNLLCVVERGGGERGGRGREREGEGRGRDLRTRETPPHKDLWCNSGCIENQGNKIGAFVAKTPRNLIWDILFLTLSVVLFMVENAICMR